MKQHKTKLLFFFYKICVLGEVKCKLDLPGGGFSGIEGCTPSILNQ